MQLLTFAVSDNPVDWDQWQPGDSGAGEGAGLHCEDPEFIVCPFPTSYTSELTGLLLPSDGR